MHWLETQFGIVVRFVSFPGIRTFVVDLAVTVDVGLPDHLIHLLVRQLLSKIRHHVTQLGSAGINQ